MTCPFCGHADDRVVDSREVQAGVAIRRRRACAGCGRRFTTHERIDEILFMVVKKDGAREPFDRRKVIAGLRKACEKRPVTPAAVDAVADRIEAALSDRSDREMAASEIGRLVMDELRQLDGVAYVRFASVYRDFRDVDAFMAVLRDLQRGRT